MTGPGPDGEAADRGQDAAGPGSGGGELRTGLCPGGRALGGAGRLGPGVGMAGAEFRKAEGDITLGWSSPSRDCAFHGFSCPPSTTVRKHSVAASSGNQLTSFKLAPSR